MSTDCLLRAVRNRDSVGVDVGGGMSVIWKDVHSQCTIVDRLTWAS